MTHKEASDVLLMVRVISILRQWFAEMDNLQFMERELIRMQPEAVRLLWGTALAEK